MAEDMSRVTAYLQEHGKKILPTWEELPDIELYMDQVVALTNRYLGNDTKEKMVTSSMVNNYVKMKVMPAPVKKKYTRTHLMYLIVICILKQVMPLSSVEVVLREGLTREEPAVFYTRFRALYAAAFENTLVKAQSLCEAGAASGEVMLALAMNAQAEQAMAQELLELN